MDESSMTSHQGSGTARAPVRLSVATKDNTPFVTGRRVFFKYRDLGVSAATDGRMRTQVMSAISGMTEPTGWHCRLCEAQFIDVLRGWLELEFEDVTRTRSEPGNATLIPGGMKHNEIATSDDVEILEISVPGDMGTKACAPRGVRPSDPARPARAGIGRGALLPGFERSRGGGRGQQGVGCVAFSRMSMAFLTRRLARRPARGGRRIGPEMPSIAAVHPESELLRTRGG
jgi:hypothetical protein